MIRSFRGILILKRKQKQFQLGYYKPIICEGFGFIAIEVGIDGEIYLIFGSDADGIEKVDYKNFMEKQKLKSIGI